MSSTTTDVRSSQARATRVVRYVLVLLFLFTGVGKLLGMESARAMFEELGYSQDFRLVIGVLETAGAVGLLMAPLIVWAALGLCVIMIGATVTHLIHDPLYMAVFPLVILALLAWVAWRQPLLAGLRQRPQGARTAPTGGREQHDEPSRS